MVTDVLDELSAAERMLLLKFVCAFAWADLEVTDTERHFVRRLVKRLELSEDEAKEVEQWLAMSPAPHSMDPKRIPENHRQIFIEAVRGVIYVDGHVDPDEREAFDKLKAALGA